MTASRRPAVFLALSFLLATLQVLYDTLLFGGVFIGLLFYSVIGSRNLKIRSDRIKQQAYCVLMLVLYLVAVMNCTRVQYQNNRIQTILSKMSDIKVQGVVSSREENGDRYKYYLKNCLIYGNQKVTCNKILLYLDSGSYSSGDTLIVTGKVSPFREPRNQGEMNEELYYRSLGISLRCFGETVIRHSGKVNHFNEMLFSVRLQITEIIHASLERDQAQVLSSMLLGNPISADNELKLLFQKAGISHILAISGLHLSIIGIGVFKLLKKRAGFFLSVITTVSIIYCYILLTGFKISALRAGIMLAVYLYSQYQGRSYDLLSALSLAMILLLSENPYLIQSSGFLLSILAVTGIGTAGLMFENMSGKDNDQADLNITKHKKERRLKFKRSLMTGIWIQLFLLPCLSYFYFETAVYAVLLNLIVIPLMGVLITVSIIGVTILLLLPMPSRAILLPSALILELFKQIAEITSKLPMSVLVIGRPNIPSILFWYGVLLLLFLFIRYLYQPTSVHRIVLFAFLLVFPVQIFLLSRHTEEITLLDVGQGDGIYVSTGSGEHVMIDGGSTSEKKVGTYRILPFLKSRGIPQIDYWFLSHGDEDHTSGFYEIAGSGYPIKTVLISEYMKKDSSYDDLITICQAYKIQVVQMQCGSKLSSDQWQMEAIFPNTDSQVKDRNSGSLVLLYEGMGVKALFTGDISSAEEELLLDERFTDINILKSAHHGSDTSNSDEFLSLVSPDITLISCGKDNPYNHPGAGALERIVTNSSKVYNTMETGQITIQKDMKIEIFLKKDGMED
ncbi:MAG: DNA internalization-related competence protein ComEC/Rec2 [Lachnospiraceae bacterium]